MKKTLLICAALAASSLAMAQEAFTSYDFTTCKVVPTARNQGANVPAGSFYTFNGAAEFARNGGFVAASGGQWANEAQPYFDNLLSGWSFVDLGGEVGRCLCLYGPKYLKTVVGEGDDAEEFEVGQYDFNAVYGTNIPMAAGGINWGNLNFYTNPETTPTAPDGIKALAEAGKHVRVEIIINIYSQLGESAPYFNTIYSVDDQNNVRPTQNVANAAPGSAINIDEFFDNETYEWNANKWLKYEFDTFVGSRDSKGVDYSPLHLKMEMNGGKWAGQVVFIKSIKFYAVDDIQQDGDTGRKRTWLTLNPDLENIKVEAVDGVQAPQASANGKAYDLSGRQVSAKASGLYISNGKKYIVK